MHDPGNVDVADEALFFVVQAQGFDNLGHSGAST
jgi:hypothetical protein